MSSDRKAAYQRLEEAIQAVCAIEDFEGVLTEWVIVTALQHYDDDADAVTQIGKLLPEGGGVVPYHRVMGLLDYALTLCRVEIADAER